MSKKVQKKEVDINKFVKEVEKVCKKHQVSIFPRGGNYGGLTLVPMKQKVGEHVEYHVYEFPAECLVGSLTGYMGSKVRKTVETTVKTTVKKTKKCKRGKLCKGFKWSSY